jgi:hypothetical protein
MENVILADSPLAEFLEGMHAAWGAYQATGADKHRQRRRTLAAVLTHNLHLADH